MTKTTYTDFFKDIPLISFDEYPSVITGLYEYMDTPYREAYDRGEVLNWFIVGGHMDTHKAEEIEKRTKGNIKFYYSERLSLWLFPMY